MPCDLVVCSSREEGKKNKEGQSKNERGVGVGGDVVSENKDSTKCGGNVERNKEMEMPKIQNESYFNIDASESFTNGTRGFVCGKNTFPIGRDCTSGGD